VFAGAYSVTLQSSAALIAAGNSGTDYIGSGSSGGGGGGAGGSILLKLGAGALGSNLVTAIGGGGGLGASNDDGGSGSVGRIHIEYCDGLTGTTYPLADVQSAFCPTVPIATINTIYPLIISQGLGPVTFRGLAASPDVGGATIVGYSWRSDRDGVLSTQPSFTRSAASLSIGTHTIYFKAKANNNDFWSPEISRTLVIQPPRLFLPAVLRNPGFGPFEVEPNNSPAQANGPLLSGVDYHGYQNDSDDYFKFDTHAAGSITVDLTNVSGGGTQLQLFYQSTSNRVGYAGNSPYHIAYTGPSGTYYVRVYTGSGFNSATAYLLKVTYP
jgi:hypothetical protein